MSAPFCRKYEEVLGEVRMPDCIGGTGEGVGGNETEKEQQGWLSKEADPQSE